MRRVSVRATEIEMRDKSRLIVPNSDPHLQDRAQRHRRRRHGSGEDRAAARRRRRSANGAPDPARRDRRARGGSAPPPPPAVYISDVKEGALEFTAFAYVASPRRAFAVKSDLLFEIIPALAQKGVALASSTPVVNVTTTSAPPPRRPKLRRAERLARDGGRRRRPRSCGASPRGSCPTRRRSLLERSRPKGQGTKDGPLIEGDLVIRAPSWRRRAARWVYAGSRRATQTYGPEGGWSCACWRWRLCSPSPAPPRSTPCRLHPLKTLHQRGEKMFSMP